MSVSSILNSVFRPETWCCAVRFNSNEEKCILNDLSSPFMVIPNSKRYWTADPFIVENDGKYYLFFEAFDKLKKKGLLGYREISENNFGPINIIYESKSHLSFPFIYKENETYYIIPESNKQNELFQLKCISFPDKWEKEMVITNSHLVDTVIYVNDGVKYYISEKVDSNNYFDRVDLFYEENGELTEFIDNPVKRDINNARGAGNLFEYNGSLIRPAQNCGKSYGEKLNFNQVDEISKSGYKETFLCDISVKSVILDCENIFNGIHTYNKINNVEVIDLKLPRKFSLYNFIGSIRKVFAKFFSDRRRLL